MVGRWNTGHWIGWQLPLAFALSACGGQLIDSFDACQLQATVSPESALPGETVTLLGGPLTAPYDSLVQVDGVAVPIETLDRSSECADCDLCRDETLSCGGCIDRCDTCVETLTFLAPDLASGPKTLILTNAYGTTGAIPFAIAEATITDTGAVTTP